MAHSESRIVQAARIVRIADGFAWFDIGSKFESPIPLTDWEQVSQPHIGDTYQVMIDDDCDFRRSAVEDPPSRSSCHAAF